MRGLFQLAKCHLDLVLVSDEAACLKNNLIDTSGAEKLQTNASEVKRGQNPLREPETNTTIVQPTVIVFVHAIRVVNTLI